MSQPVSQSVSQSVSQLISQSVKLTTSARSFVFEWQVVTVAWCHFNRSAIGEPCRERVFKTALINVQEQGNKDITIRPATIHRCTGTSRYFFPWYEYRILIKLSRYLRYIYICINKHGKALSSISAHPPSTYARRFSEQTDEKNPCLAVFSVVFKMADTNARVLPMSAVQTTEPTSETRGDGHVM